jgi:hypothetical protein
MKMIDDLTSAAANAGGALPGIDPLKAAREKTGELRETIEQFSIFKDSLENAEIVSACFYYEVAVPDRKQPTKIRLRFSKGSE